MSSCPQSRVPADQTCSVKNSPNGPTIDFKDAAALRELTRCLLEQDFALDVVIPEDRLCPTVSNSRYSRFS